MIASGFKPVAWVAAVGAAALSCYMLSLRVASERADLTNLQRRIVATRQQIRTLQTELGTRGRLQQLEQWNDDVLALAAPVSGQYLHSNVELARFGTGQAPPLAAPAEVRMAAADAARAAVAPVPAPQHALADARSVAPPPPLAQPMVRRASLTVAPQPAPTPVRAEPSAPAVRPAAEPPAAAAPAPVRLRSAETGTPTPARAHIAAPEPRPRAAKPGRPAALLDDRTLRELGSAARAERAGGTRD